MKIRNSIEADVGSILRIYSREVTDGFATFEEVPPSLEEMARRRYEVLQLGLPYLIAEIDQQIVGYAYANNHRPRPAYRNSIENSVYVDEQFRGKGIGKALLKETIRQCEKGDWRQMIAVIGDSENVGSIELHSSLGFRHVGTLKSVGFKLGRWVDTVMMQLSLNEGANSAPSRR